MLLLLDAGAFAQDPTMDLGAWVEGFVSWNADDPANGVNNLRGFDDRAGTLTLANVVADATGTAGPLGVHVALQAGHTGTAYYSAEPALPATGSAGASDAALWRNVQQATIGWDATDTLAFGAGLFLSPIGPESMAVKDDWNFSRSNLFFGLPFYHTGAFGVWKPAEPWKLTAGVTNGWNSVTDGNAAKSPFAQLLLTGDDVTAAVLYFGGVERPAGAPEGKPWRHLADAWVQVDATARVSFLLHGDAGMEAGKLGTNTWLAGAAYARVQPVGPLYIAARGDWFVEKSDGGSALFWPASVDGVGRVASGTLTFDVRPVESLSLRVEGRHDAANAPMFFDRKDVPTESTQDTLTLGVVAWIP